MDTSIIYSTPAALWDGARQLSGTIVLKATELIFRLDDFKKSHLNLVIPLSQIERVEEALIFDLARNGIHIQNKNGTHDLFVLEDGQQFKMTLLACLASIKKYEDSDQDRYLD